MRKNFFLFPLLILALLLPMAPGALAAPAPPVDWAWLIAQAASGAAVITLPNSIARDSDEGLVSAVDTLRIEGGGHTITGAVVDGGTIAFKDVRLQGTHGYDDEDGGDGLTLRGEGTIAVLMGTTRAEGGRSGRSGDHGGDGIVLEDAGQGLIMKDTTTAAGGIGCLYGGAGVSVRGEGANVLLAGGASLVGGVGLATGGAGISAPACCKVSLGEEASATGGQSSYQGGSGIDSAPCEAGGGAAPIVLSGIAMAIGGVGADGGHGVLIAREGAGEAGLRLEDTVMLLGGDGNLAGSALHATDATVDIAGTPMLFGGMYYETPAEAVALMGSARLAGDADAAAITEGGQTANYPARNVSSIIYIAVNQQSDRYTPAVIEDGLGTRDDLQTKLNGFTVERGNVSQAKLNGNGLKIFMFSGTLEKRLQFQQRLMDDGEGGTRYLLIGAVSDEWPTLESSVAAIRKLHELGMTQIAYTCAAPVYNERVLDIAALLEAIEADGEVAKVMCGTADDAIIFIREDGTRDYQEELMAEVIRPAF